VYAETDEGGRRSRGEAGGKINYLAVKENSYIGLREQDAPKNWMERQQKKDRIKILQGGGVGSKNKKKRNSFITIEAASPAVQKTIELVYR